MPKPVGMLISRPKCTLQKAWSGESGGRRFRQSLTGTDPRKRISTALQNATSGNSCPHLNHSRKAPARPGSDIAHQSLTVLDVEAGLFRPTARSVVEFGRISACDAAYIVSGAF